MSKIFILLLSLISFVFGAKNTWDHQFSYKLKKDEVASIVLYTPAKKNSKELKKRDLFFRWTLIVKDRVTILVNNQGHPHQYILYKKRSLDSVRLSLLPDGEDRIVDNAYMLLVLSDINQRNNEVDFDIFIKDQKKRILVDFEQPKKQ